MLLLLYKYYRLPARSLALEPLENAAAFTCAAGSFSLCAYGCSYVICGVIRYVAIVAACA